VSPGRSLPQREEDALQNHFEDDIRIFIAENFMFRDDTAGLDAAQSLLEAGLIDSTGVLELVAFLEGRYGIRIPDADMVPANLDSVAGLVAYVSRRLSAAQAPA
jgi:acyl carrier protein